MAIQKSTGSSAVITSLSEQALPPERKSKALTNDDKQLLRRQEAERTAQEFETLFVDMMVKSMRQTAQPEETSNAEDIYQGMLDSEYSKSMTASKNFGIREQILNWMELADPTLKAEKTHDAKPPAENNAAASAENLKIQNEMWALKAASQAYQLSGQSR